MSIEYWPIVIYGLKVDQSILNLRKVAKLIGLENEDEIVKDGVIKRNCLHDFLDALTWQKGCEYLEWIDSAEMEDGIYLGLPAGYPWQFNSDVAYKNLTAEKVRADISNLLKPYLKEGVDVKALEKEIDYYEAVGCA
jgi:hypothetical protein